MGVLGAACGRVGVIPCSQGPPHKHRKTQVLPPHLGRAPLDPPNHWARGVHAARLKLPAGLDAVEQHSAALPGLGRQAVARAVGEGGAVVAAGGGDVGEAGLAALLHVVQVPAGQGGVL